MPPERTKQLPKPTMHGRSLPAGRPDTRQRRDSECSKSEPTRCGMASAARPAAEARRNATSDATRGDWIPSRPKPRIVESDEIDEAAELNRARLTPELSRAEGVGLN